MASGRETHTTLYYCTLHVRLSYLVEYHQVVLHQEMKEGGYCVDMEGGWQYIPGFAICTSVSLLTLVCRRSGSEEQHLLKI